jgi:hypothetical protein
MDDCRRPQEHVRPCGRPSGGRPPGCPLAPSSRQARVSIWDGCPGGCPSGCPAVGSEWESDRLSCLEGAGEQDERVLAISETTLGPDHPAVATYRGNLGNVLQALGDLEGARAQYKRMLTVSEAALGPDHPTVAAFPRYATTSTACSGPSKRRLLRSSLGCLASLLHLGARSQPPELPH